MAKERYMIDLDAKGYGKGFAKCDVANIGNHCAEVMLMGYLINNGDDFYFRPTGEIEKDDDGSELPLYVAKIVMGSKEIQAHAPFSPPIVPPHYIVEGFKKLSGLDSSVIGEEQRAEIKIIYKERAYSRQIIIRPTPFSGGSEKWRVNEEVIISKLLEDSEKKITNKDIEEFTGKKPNTPLDDLL